MDIARILLNLVQNLLTNHNRLAHPIQSKHITFLERLVVGASVGIADGTEVVVQVPIHHLLESLVAIIANLYILPHFSYKLFKVGLRCHKLANKLNFT